MDVLPTFNWMEDFIPREHPLELPETIPRASGTRIPATVRAVQALRGGELETLYNTYLCPSPDDAAGRELIADLLNAGEAVEVVAWFDFAKAVICRDDNGQYTARLTDLGCERRDGAAPLEWRDALAGPPVPVPRPGQEPPPAPRNPVLQQFRVPGYFRGMFGLPEEFCGVVAADHLDESTEDIGADTAQEYIGLLVAGDCKALSVDGVFVFNSALHLFECGGSWGVGYITSEQYEDEQKIRSHWINSPVISPGQTIIVHLGYWRMDTFTYTDAGTVRHERKMLKMDRVYEAFRLLQ